jgi:hypothetical protein
VWTPCPAGRRPVGGALAPVADHRLGIWGLTDRVSVFHAWPVWGLAGKGWDHVSGKRCSRLDLHGCNPGPGYAARDLNTQGTKLAYGSLRLRDGVRAAPSSSQVVSRIFSAPPLWAPARVIPGRTLLEGEGRVGYRASSQLQSTPPFRLKRLPGVPVPVPLLRLVRRKDSQASPSPLGGLAGKPALTAQGRIRTLRTGPPTGASALDPAGYGGDRGEQWNAA